MMVRNVSWALAGNTAYAISQWLMLVVLAKWANAHVLGVYALALAVTAPTFALTNGDQRAAQATDVRGEFTFARYLGFRCAGTVVAALIVCGIAVSGFLGSVEACIATTLLFMARAAESLSDVVYGQFQLRERLDFVGQSILLRSVLQILCFLVVIVCGGGLAWALLSNALVALVVWGLIDMKRLSRFLVGQHSISVFIPVFSGLAAVVVAVIPFGLQVFINVLSQNVPRYFVQSLLDQRSLGIFSSVAYFVVAGGVLINALGQSAMPRLARYYAVRSVAYNHLISRLLLVCLGLCSVGLLLVHFFGEWLLVLVYSPDFKGSGQLFFVISIFASLLYLSVIAGTGLTSARAMRGQTVVCLVSLSVLSAASYFFVPRFGLLGGAYAMVAGAIVQCCGLWCLVVFLMIGLARTASAK